MIIGITGGSGSGKSSVAKLLGYEVIDADKIYHELLATNDALRAELSGEFGTCERHEIAKMVFADAEKLERLNEITFKYTVAAIEKLIPLGGDIVIDVPLLFETGLDEKCDVTIGVIANAEVRIERIMERDGISRKQAELRIAAQKPDSFYIERADYIVSTDNA